MPAIKDVAELKNVHDTLVAAAEKNEWSLIHAGGPPNYSHPKVFKEQMCLKNVGLSNVGLLSIILFVIYTSLRLQLFSFCR